MTQPTIELTQDQIDFFHANGFLAIEAITTQDEIAWMREVYDELFSTRTGREEGNQFDLAGADEEGREASLPQILNPTKYAPELKDSLYMANAAVIAKQLLGELATFQGDHAILKPAGHGAPTPWHQDEAYWGAELEYNALSTWMPLQQATVENGCMYFIPGSHKLPVMPHHSINHDPRVHGLEIDEVDESLAVACPLPAGGATFHLSRTMHYAPPNRSDAPRRAYILGFGSPPKPRADKRDFYWMTQKQTAREERAQTFARQQK